MRILIGKIHHRRNLNHGIKHHAKHSNLDHLKDILKDMNLTHSGGNLKETKKKHRKIII